MRFYSIIIPVFNRPDEVKELLESLVQQSFTEFEVIIVEDGSTTVCKEEVEQFAEKLTIQYYYKENSGQGFSRNFGFEKAIGDYFIVLDSDCLVPPQYLAIVDNYLNKTPLDAFGGPDRADESFTLVQKAINYSMTSTLTTGGIRGKKTHAGTYHPRSFNMGISRHVYEKTGGYKITRMGEDIEFSIRMIENNFKVGLIEDAFVYHKRRTNLIQFYKQLHFFGRARINVSRFYPNEIQLAHLFPLAFLMGWIALIISWFVFKPIFIFGLGLISVYYLLIFLESTVRNKNPIVGVLSWVTSTIQLSAYAIGMVTEYFMKPTGS